MDEITFTQPTQALYESYNSCVSAVARERRYIGIVNAPTMNETRDYVVAINDISGHITLAVTNDRVIGWCSTTHQTDEGFTHVAHIGMGLLPDYRGRGLGRRLLDDALNWSWDSGYERVELSVFTDNEIAIRLYRSAGFVEEGTRRKARKLNGSYNDIMQMGIFNPGLQ
ncbi:MAG: GNAT family N-acetyltransferase [Chloroflexi bacterium]|jgi:RimJ/RimL family protein N-acetyltransferase|nr:GNAT family N-acetyltransferase [Chloroflexota bacterium]MBT4073153.1 GNAT family N-acetyltransferase [Chloroflexota bacterium]MBT4515339.1 GNAT family N-acetyltransferase [Chloroflexota bacterium]MBT6683139.1 GNAT family N-acetyltransferase [Chloroflexota bacterium]